MLSNDELSKELMRLEKDMKHQEKDTVTLNLHFLKK
jgi:hypothetical protein